MKTILAARTWMVIIAGCWLSATVLGQITFVTAPQGSATPANRQTQQGGLSPEKKKSLSKYGPEDAFPGASEQENQQRQTTRTSPRRTATTSPTSTPASTATATPTPATVAVTSSPSASIPTSATTNNTAASTTSSAQNSTGYNLVPVTLATAALLVFGALIYVVGSLRKKLKETR